MSDDRVTIGKVASQTGCNIETIRYDEKESLLPPPGRTEGGHRLYSVGFVVKEGDEVHDAQAKEQENEFPFPIDKAVDLLKWCEQENASIDEIVMRNELSRRSRVEIEDTLDEIWLVMKQAAFLGCHSEGVLPGGLNVKRRAASINQ